MFHTMSSSVAIEDWSAWLSEGDEAEEMQILRRNIEKSLLCGSERFVQKLGKQVGRLLTHRPEACPKKLNDEQSRVTSPFLSFFTRTIWKLTQQRV
ncbi:MAG: hypothetical protein V4623_10985 [Pseudomonadota bacterium]